MPNNNLTEQCHYENAAMIALLSRVVVYVLLAHIACADQSNSGIKTPEYQVLPSLREQAAIQDTWTKERASHVPEMLRKYHVDAWIISQREYAEDTVFWSLKSAVQFSARRRTLSVFFANVTGGSPSSHTWIDNTREVFSSLGQVLEDQQPSSIALNTDQDIAFSGGLHAGELNLLLSELDPKWHQRIVSEPMLAVELIGTMVTERLPWYRKLQETAWAMISEAFSERVISPGKTTTTDVEWWLRDKIQAMNYSTWFMPSVSIVEANSSIGSIKDVYTPKDEDDAIDYGDLLHVDFGVTAMGLNTDTQHLAYVLHPHENDVPEGLKEGLKTVNRLQDIVRSNMKIGYSGNDILQFSKKQMKSEGIEGKIYCHPIGDWGHSAGTLIGMTNLQNGVPVLGDLFILKNTYYSVELYAEHFVPERNETLNFYQEEDVFWNDVTQTWDWVYGRQEEYHLIRSISEQHHDKGLRVQQ